MTIVEKRIDGVAEIEPPKGFEDSEGFKKLARHVRVDMANGYFHDYLGKLHWTLDRARQYARACNLTPAQVLDRWEQRRDYWYMNYYQDSNQPAIDHDRVRVFEDYATARAELKLDDLSIIPKFRCPMCSGISQNPYACTVEGCDWKVYGLFGDLGKGVYVVLKDEAQIDNIFMPVHWELDFKKDSESCSHTH